MFIFVVFGLVLSSDLCKFAFGKWQHIDLSGVPTMHIDLTECGGSVEKDHQLIMKVCSLINETVCEGPKESGPANGCDFYSEPGIQTYGWVGGLEGWKKSAYNSTTKSWTSYYPGKTSYHRDLEVEMKCDHSIRTPVAKCVDIENTSWGQIYKVQFTARDACPHWFKK